jgi:hypothetical protein
MNRIDTLILAAIFIPATCLALVLDNYSNTVLIPRWCDQSPICRASRTATAADPIRF